MIQNKTTWLKPLMAAGLMGLALFVTGCGGGGGSSNHTPPPSTSRFNAQFSKPIGGLNLLTSGTYALDKGVFTSAGAGHFLQLQFGKREIGSTNFGLNITKVGNIKGGDSFTLANKYDGPGDSGMTVFYTDETGERPRLVDLQSHSGTFEVETVVLSPAVGNQPRTALVKFNITNAVIKNGDGTRGITVNGSGEVLVDNYAASN